MRATPSIHWHAQFAADAAVRHPYKAEVPRGGEAVARSQVGYALDRLYVAGLRKAMAWHAFAH